MELTGKLAQSNGRLKSANVGVRVEQHGNRLYLRATLPPKPGSSKLVPFQQRIPLGIHANPAGLKLAEIEARKVGALLDAKEFDWEPYLNLKSDTSKTCLEWVEAFENEYFSQRERNHKTETTWKIDYRQVFIKLPENQPLTVDIVDSLIRKTKPDTRTRKRYCIAINALCKFAGLEYNALILSGKYSSQKAVSRKLPTDEQIIQFQAEISNPAWRWIFGILATYGLRPHEVFRIENLKDFANKKTIILKLSENTKTGKREVFPFYPEWVEQFNLHDVQLPNVTVDRSNSAIGKVINQTFRRYYIPCQPYDLRHAWAIRTIAFGLPDTLAAQQMGHSVAVHTDLYHRYTTKNHHQQVFEMLLARPDRPLPPTIATVDCD